MKRKPRYPKDRLWELTMPRVEFESGGVTRSIRFKSHIEYLKVVDVLVGLFKNKGIRCEIVEDE